MLTQVAPGGIEEGCLLIIGHQLAAVMIPWSWKMQENVAVLSQNCLLLQSFAMHTELREFTVYERKIGVMSEKACEEWKGGREEVEKGVRSGKAA